VPVLERHRVEQERERALAGEAWQEHDLVFTQPDGSPVDPRRDWADWKELLAVAGVRDARVHDGRHTAGTLLVEQGVHVRVVQEILGHTDIRITQRYAHASSAAVTDAASRMGQALWGASGQLQPAMRPNGSRPGVGNDEPPAPGRAA
jgi:site-specific recombinase XerD